jgi:hypothetical protein
VISAGHAARIGQIKTAYRILIGKYERKRPVGRPRHTWEDNIKMNLQELGCKGVDWNWTGIEFSS